MFLKKELFAKSEVRKIYARVFPENKKSIKLLRVCGFSQERVLKNNEFNNGSMRIAIVFASDEYYKNLSLELLELMESFETRAQAADTLGAIIQLIEVSAFRREERASKRRFGIEA